MVSATIHRRESEKPSVSGKTFPLLRLLSSEPIDEISKGFVFSASLVGLFCELPHALGTDCPRAYCTSSNLLGFGVVIIAKVAKDIISGITYNDLHIILISFLVRSFSLRQKEDSRQNPSIVKVESRLGGMIPFKNKI